MPDMQHASLAAALAAFQTELPKLTKDEKAKVKGETKDGRSYDRSYGYADLAQVVETVLPVLGKHGLSVSAKNVFTPEGYILTVTLKHESGESDSGDWPLPDPRRSGPQDIGSAMTYGRRYLTLALSGAYPGGEDDDGAKAQAQARSERALPENFSDLPRERPQANRPVSAPPATKAPAKDWTKATDAEVLDLHAKLDTLELEKAGQLYDWMAERDIHNRPVAGDDYGPITGTTRLAVRVGRIAQDETTTTANLAWLLGFADGRGLLKTPVSPQSNLGEWLSEQKKIRTAAVVADSDNAQAMKQAAADSWADDKHPQPTPEQEPGADLRIDNSDPTATP